MAKIEKAECKTPNGGARAEIHYFDDNGSYVDEKKASRCVIREFSENGEMVFETWGTVENE
ncbi:MAG: hypothetical protein ACI3W6_09160 [Clostridia bacterium]